MSHLKALGESETSGNTSLYNLSYLESFRSNDKDVEFKYVGEPLRIDSNVIKYEFHMNILERIIIVKVWKFYLVNKMIHVIQLSDFLP